MATPSYTKTGLNMVGKILASARMSATTATAVYSTPVGSTAQVKTATLCNTGAAAVTASVEILRSGDTADGTHRVLTDYSIPAKSTLTIKDEIGGLMLSESESISVQVSAAGVVCVVITGVEST